MHLRTFFDLWDSVTLQAVQNGQPYISDHIMFEVRTHSFYQCFILHPQFSFPRLSWPCYALLTYGSVPVSDPPATAVAGSFLGCVQHTAGWLSGHLCAVSALAVGAETLNRPTATAAAGRQRRHIWVKTFLHIILQLSFIHHMNSMNSIDSMTIWLEQTICLVYLFMSLFFLHFT